MNMLMLKHRVLVSVAKNRSCWLSLVAREEEKEVVGVAPVNSGIQVTETLPEFGEDSLWVQKRFAFALVADHRC